MAAQPGWGRGCCLQLGCWARLSRAQSSLAQWGATLRRRRPRALAVAVTTRPASVAQLMQPPVAAPATLARASPSRQRPTTAADAATLAATARTPARRCTTAHAPPTSSSRLQRAVGAARRQLGRRAVAVAAVGTPCAPVPLRVQCARPAALGAAPASRRPWRKVWEGGDSQQATAVWTASADDSLSPLGAQQTELLQPEVLGGSSPGCGAVAVWRLQCPQGGPQVVAPWLRCQRAAPQCRWWEANEAHHAAHCTGWARSRASVSQGCRAPPKPLAWADLAAGYQQ